MADVNTATSTGGSEFSKLRDVILRHSALLPRVIDLARVRGLDSDLRQALVDVIRSETCLPIETPCCRSWVAARSIPVPSYLSAEAAGVVGMGRMSHTIPYPATTSGWPR